MAGIAILVGVGLVGVAGLVAAVAFVRRLSGRAGPSALASVPDTIELVRDDDAEWRDPAAVDRAIDHLEGEGFVRCGAFRLEPLAGQRAALLLAPDRHSAAAVFDHPEVGAWIDLWAVDADGGSYATTNGRGLGSLDQPPWARRTVLAGASVAEVARAFRAEGFEGAVELSAEELPRRVEDEWRRETLWRKARGVSLREIGKVATKREVGK
jgi:hypothetical protein